MLFKLLYLPAFLHAANRSYFSYYDMVMFHNKEKIQISLGFFVFGVRSRLANKSGCYQNDY